MLRQSQYNGAAIFTANLRFQLYLDCMEVTDMPGLDVKQIDEIKSLALRQGKLRFPPGKVSEIIEDIQLEYQRVMCDLAWRKFIIESEYPEVLLTSWAKVHQRETSRDFKPFKILPTAMKDFKVIRKTVHWNTLYVLPEVYDTLKLIVENCSHVSNMSLFGSITKSLNLHEFESQQLQAITTAIKYLNEQWLEKIIQSMKMCLRDIGKGCFDLNQRNFHVYNEIKLRKLIELIIFMMQNALFNLVENSTKRYLSLLKTPTLMINNINSSFEWGSNLVDSQFPCESPLFDIPLALNNNGAHYLTDLNEFGDTIVQLFDDALNQCHGIKQPQLFLLPGLIFSPQLTLSSVGLLDERICSMRNQLKAAYHRALIPLQAYANEYKRYTELYTLDVENYIRNIREEFDVVRVRDEISFQIAARDELYVNLPKNICIGPFKVHVETLKSSLIDKRKNLILRLLEMFTEQLRNQMNVLLSKYMEMESKLNKEPRSIEEVFEIREFMELIPMEINEVVSTAQRLSLEYDILDLFNWNIPDEDFHSKWQALGYPQRIKKQLEVISENSNNSHEKFLKIQIIDQMNLSERIEALAINLTNIATQTDIEKVHECAIDAKITWKALQECENRALLLNQRQRLFDLPIISYDDLTRLLHDFEPYKTLWCTASDWLKAEEAWLENPLKNIDSEQMEVMVNDMHKTMLHSVKYFHEQPMIASIASAISEKIELFRPYVKLVQSLKSPGMKARHFDEIVERTGVVVSADSSETLKNILQRGIMNFMEILTDITESAGKEYFIEAALNKMKNAWNNIQMDIIPYKNTGTFIMKISDDTLAMLDEHTLNTQQLGFSPYRNLFEDVIVEWDVKLKLTQEVLTQWINVQKSWMYLEPIFSSEDISRQLPVETKKFNTCDRNWRRIMRNAADCSVIMQIAPDKNLLESLKECSNLMDIVQKGLNDYLETKRTIFPRFYFLSNDELLEILAQTKNVRAVQSHLHKCFENIKQLKFEDDLQITKMYSAENEEVSLTPSMYPIGNVENWLGQVEITMKNTLRELIGKALGNIATTSRKNWVYLWPGQVVIVAAQTYWTCNVEIAIIQASLKHYYDEILNNLEQLRQLVRENPTELQRLMLEALITIQVHERDVVASLIKKSVHNVKSFDWISQLRYYWNDSNVELEIHVVNAQFPYSYEYLGNSGRLVITPLTDRCYLTLTGALHLKFGGAPAGPAGTGKTETTKDLAKAFAIQCVVFNCSEQLDFIAMGKFFKGLASSGAWACFDEFNRIDIEVLSVIAQQILTIQKAQHMCLDRFLFEGVDIALKKSCAIFVTMNPGYAGRTELPDNLKALFRPCAMMVPNYALIAEISLFSYGFIDAKNLAGKITTTFKLSSEQLSSQDHYDFGMRAVKTVIAYAGNLKREEKELPESQICLRALNDVNTPKFLNYDLTLFNGIVSDLFPGLVEIPADHGILEMEIRKSIQQMHLNENDEFIRKVIQLYETTTVRHGLMLVGATGSGKTKSYEILKDACTKLQGQLQSNGEPFQVVHTHVLNPKAITLGQLYGEFDVDTHEWTDGLVSHMLRTGSTANDSKKRWYVFDGPVDALWIENMNTLLDDNKKLCLTSGEIIKLLPTQTMMFEVADLHAASPATVSRCGMIYCETLNNQAIIDCWIQSMAEDIGEFKAQLSELMNQLIHSGFELLRGNLQEIITSVNISIIQAFLNLLSSRLELIPMLNNRFSSAEMTQKIISKFLVPWVIFSLIWSLGATCNHNSRYIFSDWLREMQIKFKHSSPLPSEGLVYDYRLNDTDLINNVDDNLELPTVWINWLDDFVPHNVPFEVAHSNLIPTMDNIRNSALIEYLLRNNSNILCVGPTGSGKTLTISQKLSTSMPKQFIYDFIVFSARTTANKVQDLIDSKLEKRKKNIYGPALLKKQIFFIDDFSMPMIEVHGAQPPLELIRQFMDFKGWYDRKDIGSFRMIEDVNFLCAMTPLYGGGNPVSDRILRHFHMITFPDMEDEAKKTIFRTILKSWLIRTSTIDLLEKVVAATLNVFSDVCRELLPTPNKSHYTFNLRDLTRIFHGILMAEPGKIQSSEELLFLWYHEHLRVIGDRLIDQTDIKWLDELLRKNAIQYFGEKSSVPLDETLFYGDFCSELQQYERITDRTKMESIIAQALEDYNNSTTSPMKLVLFDEAMSHICRITRILRQTRGNALLLGLGGSGRRSLTRLAAFLCDYTCFEIELRKGYSINDWQDDMKGMMLKAGLHSSSIVFLFSDTQIKDETYLEDINNILNNGDIPNIYKADELNTIYQSMRSRVMSMKLQINRTNLFNAYLHNVRNNLHTVITMSPIGDKFRSRIRQFPAFVNCCTIDWFHPWPDRALQSVAKQFISEIHDNQIVDNVFNSIIKTCQFMHTSTIEASENYLQLLNRHNYVTPISYLEMLSNYKNLLLTRKTEIASRATRLSSGLSKLTSTELEVKEIQLTLTKMRPQLAEATIKTASMIEQIRIDTMMAKETKAEAERQEFEATTLKQRNEEIKKEAEAELSEVMPLLVSAEASLKALNKSDISEVKAMKRPPVGVILVIEAMCIVKDVKPLKLPGKLVGEKILDYWTPGSQMLTDPGHFLHELENFDKSNITEEMINKLKNYIENDNFQPNKIMQISKACHSLCLWIHAVYKYYFVNLKVKPKMEVLKDAEIQLVETEKQLHIIKNKLQSIENGIEELEDLLNNEEMKKNKLEEDRQLCEDRISRAVRLIDGLAEEKKRWILTVDELQKSYDNSIGDILISSGAIAYLTPFTDDYRRRLLNAWRDYLGKHIMHTPDCSPIVILGDPVEIHRWQIDGLPRDNFSTENAILMANSHRWPLFIDPQSQANKWIKKTGKNTGLSIVKMTDNDLLRVLENCVRIGRACLIEDIGLTIESALDSILTKSFFIHMSQMSIKIGDNIVPYNNQFRLYMTTKLSNPHYSPEIAVKVLLVNFILTPNGLLDQMLSLVVMQERADLEETRINLIVSSAEMKRDLLDIEERILQRLHTSEGSAIDDIDFILTLEASKLISDDIKSKMLSAETTRADIEIVRLVYLPVAKRARILYFCITDLQNIDYMYQYSLDWFVKKCIQSMNDAEESSDIEKRIKFINEYFTFHLFTSVCQGLFERNKLHFAFLVCIKIQLDEGLLNIEEWKSFVIDFTRSQQQQQRTNPATNWLPMRCWEKIQALELLKTFQGFTRIFMENIVDFKILFDQQQPESDYPSKINNMFNDFQKLLILKSLRPDRLINAIQLYINKYLGREFLELQSRDLSTMYNESSSTMPFVFILSTGTDPAGELYKFAEKLKMTRRMYTISLGQGQGPRAELMIQQSLDVGNWVFFQNCHLAPSWMSKLEEIIHNFPDNIHRDFRLWLTCMPTPDFPISILEQSNKMTIESPRGIKANMSRVFHNYISEMHDILITEDPKLRDCKSLIFALCLFHCVLLERKKFGPLGFNIPYEFTDGDLAICISQLKIFVMEYDEIPFEVLIYTAGEINYGGRITDDWDRRCVLTILHDYYNKNIFHSNYQFDMQTNLYHQLPNDSTFDDYINYIQTLPLNDGPSVVGLHANADISYATNESNLCLGTLFLLQPKEVGEATIDCDKAITSLVTEILKTIPEKFNSMEIQEMYPLMYRESLNTVLQQETELFNKLLHLINTTLSDLLKALKGQFVMTDSLELIGTCLINNKVPKLWQNKAYPSLKPLGSWLIDLKERIKFMKNWQETGIPSAFWISGFFFPQALLTGTLQNFARRHTLAIDTIDFSFQILEKIPQKSPTDGCIIYGLFLEGFRWNGKYLDESISKELYTEMKPIYLLPQQYHRIPRDNIYLCPVYKTLQRSGTLSTTGHSTNFVVVMEIPSKKPEAHWIKRGAALICALDY